MGISKLWDVVHMTSGDHVIGDVVHTTSGDHVTGDVVHTTSGDHVTNCSCHGPMSHSPVSLNGSPSAGGSHVLIELCYCTYNLSLGPRLSPSLGRFRLRNDSSWHK